MPLIYRMNNNTNSEEDKEVVNQGHVNIIIIPIINKNKRLKSQ